MGLNDFVMNDRLRFSWGHIIAFVALIIVAYVSFVGFTYLSAGNFFFGAVGMGVTVLVYLFVFIGAQQLKSSGFRMGKKIVWERVLVFGSPLIFAAGMVAMSHFWTVRSRNDEVVKQFNASLSSGRKIFDDYEAYANSRISGYDKTLDRIIAMKSSKPDLYRSAGFQSGLENMQKENMMEVLRLQLLSSNYDSLKNLAHTWVSKANAGASTYNVFLLGNTREIRDALISWESQLKDFSQKRLSNEQLLGQVDVFETNAGSAAAREIDALGESFTQQKIPTLGAIIFGIVIYLMMIFPYFIQERHSKSVYSLIGTGKPHGKEEEHYADSFENADSSRKSPKTSSNAEDDFPTF